jgi:hypothetical protein
MDRRTFVRFGFSVLTGSITLPLLARDHDGDKHGKKHDQGEDDGGEGEHEHGKGHRDSYFQRGDALYLHEYYGGPVDLPSGVRKKYYRTGKLPPGWEKRFRPFPPAVIERLPPTPPYYDRGYLDGYAVVYDRRTRVIVDLVDLLNVATGR